MKFSIIDDSASFRELEIEWNGLCNRSLHFYFQTFPWLMKWWLYRGKTRHAKLNIIIAREEQKLVFIWPLVIEKKKACNILKWMGSDINDYCDIIIDEAVESPFDYFTHAWELIKSNSGIDLIQLDKLRSDSIILPFLDQNKWQCINSNTAPCIRIDQWKNWEMYYDHFKKNLQVKTHARCQRALAKKGKVSFIINDTKQIKKIIKLIISQKIARLVVKGQSGIQEDELFFEYILEVAKMAQADKTLHLAVLFVDEKIIACHLGFLYQNTLYWFIPTFDQNYAKYSPGRMILEDLLKWCFHEKIKTFDFLLGDERYKYQWTDQDIKIHSFARHFSIKGFIYCRWASGQLKPLLKKIYNALPGDLKRKISFYLK